jgi:hypothetical protein
MGLYHSTFNFVKHSRPAEFVKHKTITIGRPEPPKPAYTERLGNWETLGVAAKKVLARSVGRP